MRYTRKQLHDAERYNRIRLASAICEHEREEAWENLASIAEQLEDDDPRTVRFWVMHPERLDWVRISLREGEQVTLGGRRRATDEGWTMSADTYTRDGDAVFHEHVSDGRDCDGRLTHGWKNRWDLADGGRLRRPPIEGAPLTPCWESDDDDWQRDEYAEAAGY